MLHHEDLIKWNSNIGNSSRKVDTAYIITKYIHCSDQQSIKKLTDNLDRLKEEDFNRIKIPKFEYTVEDNILIQTMEFIKGYPLGTVSNMSPYIFADVVNRESDWTFTDFAATNFIIPYSENRPDHLYAVDLTSYDYWPDRSNRRMRWYNMTDHNSTLIKSILHP